MPAVMLLVFAGTLFLSATLLFFIEPMVGKMMLPLLGGTPAVWNTCMVFFQAVLLAGYAFAHWTTSWLGSRRQAGLQMIVLLLPFISILLNGLFFSGLLAPNERLILGNEGNPIPALLLVLTLSVGLPMFVICTSAPLLQRWFSSTDHPAANDPYFLYGASNLGSMLMLIGYPFLVEPTLSLKNQQQIWVIGYTILAGLVGLCAVLLWKSHPSRTPELPTDDAPERLGIAEKGSKSIKKKKHSAANAVQPAAELSHAGPSTEPVTWSRRLRWIMLALVPSSLMLGATTYITTDIAAIPLLWVLPLTLYLLTFIIVFAHISPFTQSMVTVVGLGLAMAGTLGWVAPQFIQDNGTLWFIRLIGIGIWAFSFNLLKVRDQHLIHRVMILVMPLIVLLLIFMMLSDIRPGPVLNILLHLTTLFVISMVCHGELARDRPEPRHLTEFFLLMSVGGVLGGLFNALFAPLAFNALIEYPLMMVVACLLLPPLGTTLDGRLARMADMLLAAVFLIVGLLLLFMRYRDELPDLSPIKEGPWRWGLTAIAMAVGLGFLAAWFNWGESPDEESSGTANSLTGDTPSDKRLDRILDVVLPAALVILVLGLFWGLPAKGVENRLASFAKNVGMDIRQFRVILTFGLPAVLCYTFVERSVRFGLGVGALLLAAGFSHLVEDSPLHQERSFFGVLRVESGVNFEDGFPFAFHRLVHGTTLHGKQFLNDGLRDTPLSYYHHTGPVGQVFLPHNKDPKRAFAVIGLGTGTMACYGLPGQTLDFYDIDPQVVDISFDTDEYFTFVEDAVQRGVNVNLVLGDARLTFNPKGTKTRLKPLRKKKDQPVPARTFGDPLTEDQKYGIIIVDAFSSDAIPVHLITKQAVKIYFERLLEDGIVCMHISNRYLDLQPVLANIADELGVVGYHMSDDDSLAAGKNRSHWVALARKKEHLSKLLQQPRWEQDGDQLALLGFSLWPATNNALLTASGMTYALQAITEQQAQLAAREEGRTGNLSLVQGEWVPLDQVTQMGEIARDAEERLKTIDSRLKSLSGPLEESRSRFSSVEDKVKALSKEVDSTSTDLKQIEREIIASEGKDPLGIKQKLADLEKKRNDLMVRKMKLQDQADETGAPYTWVKRIYERLEQQKKRYAELLNSIPEKEARARKVGVWTDDYSNLISVFSW